MITSVIILGEELELYDDENIIINSSIVDVEDLSKVNSDKSYEIMIPASKKNLKRLKHWYNPNILDGLDNRTRFDGAIFIGGVPYRFGKFKIENVSFKQDKPSSLTLSFVSNIVQFTEKFGDDTLQSLDFSALNFEYTDTAMFYYLSVAPITTSDIIGTTFSRKRFIYDSGATHNIENTRNIHTGDDGIYWTDPILSIPVIKVIEAIETKYSLTFSRDILGREVIQKLYLLLDARTEPLVNREQSQIDSTNDATGNVDLVNSSITLVDIGAVNELEVQFFTSSTEEYTFIIELDGEEVLRSTDTGNTIYNWFTGLGEYKFYVESSDNITYNITYYRRVIYGPGQTPDYYYSYANSRTISPSTYIVSENIPSIKVFDFVQGLIRLPGMVIIPEDDGSFYIDSRKDYYKKGDLWRGFEKYVDVSSHNITNKDIPNTVLFEFEEPTTALNVEYEKNNELSYGEFKSELKDTDGNLIEGSEQEYKIPFEQVVYERLNDISGTDDILFNYGLIADENISPVSTKGHLHYVNRQTNTVGVKLDRGGSSTILYTTNQPTRQLNEHTTVIGEEFNEFTGEKITNTIYVQYHKEHIDRLTDKDTRYFNIKAKNVPVNILNKLSLNDVLEIQGKFYRIHKFKTNIITRDVSFELFNDVNLDLDYVPPVTWDRTDITWDSTTITWDSI